MNELSVSQQKFLALIFEVCNSYLNDEQLKEFENDISVLSILFNAKYDEKQAKSTKLQ